MAARSSRKRKKQIKPARRARSAAKAKRKSAKARRPKRAARPVRRKAVKARRPAKRAPRRVVRAAKRKRSVKPSRPPKKTAKAAARPRTTERPTLDRNRRVLPDDERFGSVPGYPSIATETAVASSGPGRHMQSEILRHTEASKALTAGDPDARWQDAYAVGDEAPGGDNPTPDQDRVDEIGRALGIEYEDDQELQGGEEVTKRDKHRWELDPASSDDWPHNPDKDSD